jgi:hypothetical protein
MGTMVMIICRAMMGMTYSVAEQGMTGFSVGMVATVSMAAKAMTF